MLSFLIIIVGVGNIGRYVQLRPSQANYEKDSTQLRLVSYNVRVFNTYKWSGEEIGRDSILEFVNSKQPDIVCLQEYMIHEHIDSASEAYTNELLSQTPNKHIRYTKLANSNRRKFGIATFSKFPIVHRGRIQFENSYNSCIYTDILFKSDTVRIYNLHLQSVSLKKNYTVVDSLLFFNSKRLGEIKDISRRLKRAYIQRARQVDAIGQHAALSPHPVILCGDFNDTPVSYSYHKLLGDKKDAFREAGTGIGKTYRGKLPSFRIDYVFHDDAFQATNYSTPRVGLSDHYPVVCTLKHTANSAF